jgi:quercetin dioxygenase-like cupin family protein
MDITRNGTRPARDGEAEYFTGKVRIEPLFQQTEPGRVAGSSVTFAPGARTAWHTHPLGQVLIVTAGTGRVQRWGGAVETIVPGDVVVIPAGEKHWHGAAPDAPMTHTAIHEQRDGRAADWLEQVTDAQYLA